MSEEILIHTVGDSHAWHAWLNIPFVKTHQLGPMTMYRFGQDHPIVVNDIPEEAIAVFCWGEIDCRCHIFKHPPFPETIDKLVDDYLIAVDHNAKIHPDIWLFNVVPPARHPLEENPGFPFLGTPQERLGFVRRLNERLKKSGYPFIDVFSLYSDKDGFLLPELTFDGIHIGEHKPLQSYLEKRLAEKEEESLNAIPDA